MRVTVPTRERTIRVHQGVALVFHVQLTAATPTARTVATSPVVREVTSRVTIVATKVVVPMATVREVISPVRTVATNLVRVDISTAREAISPVVAIVPTATHLVAKVAISLVRTVATSLVRTVATSVVRQEVTVPREATSPVVTSREDVEDTVSNVAPIVPALATTIPMRSTT